jgi:hypothetical protein
MKRASTRIKLICVAVFGALGVFALVDDRILQTAKAFSTGPPAGHTDGPGEASCTDCHFGPVTGGQFSITPPQTYVPGQSYQIVVRHTNPDESRIRWGFQLTALAGITMAGSFTSTSQNTQTLLGFGRQYIEHTQIGTFAGTTGVATWTFNWTAPATDVGTVTFYSAGNQANGDGTSGGDRIITATAISQPMVVDPGGAPFDFDGDGKTDIGIFRPGPGEWWINRSSNSQTFAAQFGSTSDIIAPGDFTGDNKADLAFFRPSTGFWFVLRSEDSSFFSFPFGTTGDTPVPADFDGDSKVDVAVFRPSSNTWFILRSSTGGTDIVQFGSAGDLPVPADYDGDGKADFAIFRPGPGEWWYLRSTDGSSRAFQFGSSTDKTVQGDYTGDGKADIAFWRPSTGFWFVLRSEDISFYSVPFGTGTDIPAPGDYDGDGKTDTAIFRPGETNWYIDRSSAGVHIMQFGAAGDVPLPNAFVR